VVRSGPSFTTRRDEAAAQMTDFVHQFPQAAPLLGDIIARNLDWPEADEIERRLKALLPPQLSGMGPSPEMMQMQQQMQQMGAQLQGAGQEVQKLQQDVRELTLEVQAKDLVIASKDLDIKKGQVAMTEQKVSSTLSEINTAISTAQRDAQQAQAETPEPPEADAEEIAQTVATAVGQVMAQPKIKRGRAVPQPDGSYIMESIESPTTGTMQ
jgi:hypothetical protein